MNSHASSENGRIPPTEKLNSLSSGKASIVLRVSRRCPCQFFNKSLAVTTLVSAIAVVISFSSAQI